MRPAQIWPLSQKTTVQNLTIRNDNFLDDKPRRPWACKAQRSAVQEGDEDGFRFDFGCAGTTDGVLKAGVFSVFCQLENAYRL